MRTKTQKLMLQGGVILVGALVVSSLGGWARRATASSPRVASSACSSARSSPSSAGPVSPAG